MQRAGVAVAAIDPLPPAGGASFGNAGLLLTRGLLVPANGYTVSPQRSVRALGDLFRQEGGTLISERAMKLIPSEGVGWMVMTNAANRTTEHVVVGGGAWSRQLLDPLGIEVPLETERGYHAMLFDRGVRPSLPISNKTRGFGVTPMEDELRVAGTVEIAGLGAPPNEERAEVLVQHAQRMFPALRGERVRYWMGFRPSTPDSLPILGHAQGHAGLHFIFGHGHFGMTGGPPSGRLVAQLITGQAPASILRHTLRNASAEKGTSDGGPRHLPFRV